MKALLVVDIQNDFCPGGSLGVPGGDKIIPIINKLIGKFPIVFASKDWHPAETIHFKRWPVHCVQHTKGAEFHPDLRTDKFDEIFLKGTSNNDNGYSAFEATNWSLENVLEEHNITELYLAGLTTEYCIHNSSLDAIKRGIKPIVIEDAIAAINEKEGDAAKAIKEMKEAGVQFVKSEELLGKDSLTTFIRLMGDVMIGRLVNNKISEKGYEYPWGDVLPLLRKEGVNIINLETTLTNSNKEITKVFNFKANPDKVKVLVNGNIHIANIANNHILDYDVEGLKETIQQLDKNGIIHAGAGNSLVDAKKPALINHNGLAIGVIGCTDNEPAWLANHHPGTFYLKVGDIKSIQSEILELRKRVDLLIVSIHWGPNMVERPDKNQILFAHELIDLGVDIIHGHSAHIFQGIEIYKGKVILYDTGDFVDDYAVDYKLKNDRSLLFEVEIKDKIISRLQLVPVYIDKMQVNLATDNLKESIIARMQYLSKDFGTKISDEGVIKL